MKSAAGFNSKFKGKTSSKAVSKKTFKKGHVPDTLEFKNLMTKGTVIVPNIRGTIKTFKEEGLWDLMSTEMKIKKKDDINCIICFDEQNNDQEENMMALQCGHSFHAACIKEWLDATACCPVCRD